MIKVKLTTPFPEWQLVRQTPENKGVWGDCQFFVNEKIDECDWWVVYEGLLKPERTKCPPENTILITGEPPTVKKYDIKFVKQFAKIITCHTEINHPNTIIRQQALPWMIGAQFNISTKHWSNFLQLEELSRPIEKKTKNLSIVVSKGKPTHGHIQRDKFLDRLIEGLGQGIDVFGNGYKEIPDKFDAIAPYKYHLVIENCAINDYWTEKIADAYLGESFPIYHGCLNLDEYFDPDGFEVIDINDIDNSISLIRKTICSDKYLARKKQIYDCKEKILDKYNLFQIIVDNTQRSAKSPRKNTYQIFPENYSSQEDHVITKLYKKIFSS